MDFQKEIYWRLDVFFDFKVQLAEIVRVLLASNIIYEVKGQWLYTNLGNYFIAKRDYLAR